MLCTPETFRQMLALESAINKSTSDEEKEVNLQKYWKEKRLKNIQKYLKERAARKNV